jgi:hypothetical protein
MVHTHNTITLKITTIHTITKMHMEMLNVKLAVYVVTTGLWRVNMSFSVERCLQASADKAEA